MSNRIANLIESSINLTHQREPDGRVKITTILLDNGDTFADTIWPQEAAERAGYINRLCADKPGIGTTEKKEIRRRLEQIARATAIDLRFNTCGPINGSASCSARLWSGNKPVETYSLNLFDPTKRQRAIKHLAPFVAGRNASKKKLQAAERDLTRLFMAELHRVLTAPPAPPPSTFNRSDEGPYRYDAQGIVLVKKTSFGDQPQPLTDFVAKITAEVVRDDGSANPSLDFEIEAVAGDREHKFTIPASEFREMNWCVEKLGTRGVIWAGQTEHARTAILKLNPRPTRKHVYVHTGWMKQETGWAYLHAGGAITADGLAAVDVAMDGPLVKFRLPAPPTGTGLVACVRASLAVIELAASEITIPPYCAIWRSVISRADNTVALIGPSGAGKSELAALTAQHFGAEMTRTELPFHFNSTENALGEAMFLAKDALIQIDDYKLQGNNTDDRQRRKADELIQGAGNGAGRHRMKAEGGLRVSRPPRATILVTGEQIPGTKSCIARQMVVEIGPRDIDFDKLTSCQRAGIDGMYVGAMAGFLQWLAKDDRIERVRKEIAELVPELRNRAMSSPAHKRTPGNVANLYAGLLYFLDFAVETGTLSPREQRQLQDLAWAALGRQAERQRQYLEASDPAGRYLELLESAISSGEAHVAGADGNHPGEDLSNACGWWRETPSGVWQRQGALLGYWIEEGVALLPDAAYKAIQRAAGRTDGPIGSERDVRKRLLERGLLIINKGDDDDVQRLTVQRRLAGKLRNVLLLRHEALCLSGARTARTDGAAEDATLVFDSGTAVRS